MILGTLGSILANLTVDQWIKLAPAAIEFVSAAAKLGENIEPIIARQGAALVTKEKQEGHIHTSTLAAHRQWVTAWTEANQRAADFQDGSRG